jgi:low affinity Fe/Cu permease
MSARQKINGFFIKFAVWFGDLFGSPGSFMFWFILTILWIGAGPGQHFSDTWQLWINTPTTIVELFAAITIQYVGNKIQRQQEAHEKQMISMLERVEHITVHLDADNHINTPSYMDLSQETGNNKLKE